MSVRVLHGDMLQLLPTMDAESIHAVVTDPPYHLTSIVKRFGKEGAAPAKFGTDGAYARASKGFMNAVWDGGDIAFRPETWAEVLRVMKPGAFLVAFASTRGYHRMVCAIEDAGFVIHPMLGWLFGSGFPKATRFKNEGMDGWRYGLQALKPALEPICLAQKPLVGTGSENWLAHGCGGLNIDACRVEADDKTPAPVGQYGGSIIGITGHSGIRDGSSDHLGRWPANVLHDGSDEVMEAFASFGEKTSGKAGTEGHQRKSSLNTQSTVNVAGRSQQYAGVLYADSGTAARFFYCGKATEDDRAGSKHPTVKPISLLLWLTRLICPPGGTILDPFAGSGTTGIAALRQGFDAVLVEQSAEYVEDIKRRMRLDFVQGHEPSPTQSQRERETQLGLGLF